MMHGTINITFNYDLIYIVRVVQLRHSWFDVLQSYNVQVKTI